MLCPFMLKIEESLNKPMSQTKNTLPAQITSVLVGIDATPVPIVAEKQVPSQSEAKAGGCGRTKGKEQP